MWWRLRHRCNSRPPRATEASVAQPLKVATFDFKNRQAVLWEGGREVRSTDWFPSAPEKGGKSPVMARFVFEEKNIIAKITGIWLSILPTELLPDDKRISRVAPITSNWKRSGNGVPESPESPKTIFGGPESPETIWSGKGFPDFPDFPERGFPERPDFPELPQKS